ncbi:MAG: lipid-A-disaccharide synthase [Rhodospirillales bacterium]
MMLPKLGILAGGGRLPVLIFQACQRQKRDFFVVAFEGEADPEAFDDVPHVWVRIGAVGTSIDHLRKTGCTELVMAGSVSRPSFSSIIPDKWLAQFVAKYGVLNLGDDSLLKTLVLVLEDSEGFKIIGADSLLPDLLAKKGAYGNIEPDWQAEADIECALDAALDIGRQDIAQGAIAQMGQVLAVEDDKGTNVLLNSARNRRLDGPGGVLVKVKKPGQEHRVDLPTIGVTTVKEASKTGLRGIAVQTGGALVIDPKAVGLAADQAGMFVVGIQVADKKPTPGNPAAGPMITLIAGEPSGDMLGARLMDALKKQTKGEISFTGIGGARMEEQGLKSLFPMAELSVMGAVEIIPKIPRLLARISETAATIEKLRPSALVTIDAPDFCFRVAKRLKGKTIPLIHYVAPSVWAWRPGRAKIIAGFLEHLLCLLPFEPPFFERQGLPATFVGHSILESGAGAGKGPEFRRRHGIDADDELIAVLPGSRLGEVSRLNKVFGKTLFLLKKNHPNLMAVIPTTDTVAGAVRRITAAWPVPTLVVEGDLEKYDAFAAANVALAASGTVSLELAMAKTPSIITYKINPLSFLVAKNLFKVAYVNLVNLVLEREAIPEFLQGACKAEFLATALEDLLRDESRRQRQIEAYETALKSLGQDLKNGSSPSMRAADVVLEVINAQKKPD